MELGSDDFRVKLMLANALEERHLEDLGWVKKRPDSRCRGFDTDMSVLLYPSKQVG